MPEIAGVFLQIASNVFEFCNAEL